MSFKQIFLFSIIVKTIIFSCSNKEDNLNNINIELSAPNYRLHDTLKLKNTDYFDSIHLYFYGQKYKDVFIINDETLKFGLNEVRVETFKGKIKQDHDLKFMLYNLNPERLLKYKVVNKFPHDNTLFTQGFYYENGMVFESSGLNQKSKVVKYNLGSTKFLNEENTPNAAFAEGILIFQNSIYQLTWKEKVIYIYDKESLALKEKKSLPSNQIEGWGATNNEKIFIFSDGTSFLYFYDDNFEFKKSIQVVGYNKIYDKLNELEYHNNKIYSNVWGKSKILEINPETGVVERYIDLSDLITSEKMINENSDVLNGIAFLENGNMLITGKLWGNIYEIELE